MGSLDTVCLIEGVCLIQCPLNTGFTVHISPSNDNMTVNSQLKELLSTFKRWERQFATYLSIVHILRLFLLIVGVMSVTDFTNLINVDVDDPHVLSK